MSISINIREILKGVYLPGYENIPDYDMSNIGLNATGTDALGRPYFMDVILVDRINGERLRLPNEPLVRVRKQKNLVKTVIAGHGSNTGGLVVEQVNSSNYEIDIVGIAINQDKTSPQYPQAEVIKIREFAEKSAALDIECDLINNIFGFNSIVVENFEFAEMKGTPHSQLYTLNGFSYSDFLQQKSSRILPNV